MLGYVIAFFIGSVCGVFVTCLAVAARGNDEYCCCENCGRECDEGEDWEDVPEEN